MTVMAMEEVSGKRTANGIPRKGSSLVLREKSEVNGNNKDPNGQFCNRIGCSGRLHYSKGIAQTPCSDKPKSVRTTFRAAGKEMIAGTASCKTLSTVTYSKRTFHPSYKNISNKLELDSTTDRGCSSSSSSSTSNSSLQNKIKVLEKRDAESSKNQSSQAGISSAVTPNPKPRRIFHQKSVLGNHDAQLNISMSSAASSSKSAGQVARDSASSKNGLRSLRCHITSDVLPQVSSSESNSRGKELARKRITERESSSSVKGKKLSGPSSVSSSSSMSIPEISRRSKNWASSREISAAASSVRTRRSMNISTRLGRPNQVNENNSSSRDPPVKFSLASQIESTVDGNVSNLTGESSSSAYMLPGNDNNRLRNSIRASMEHGISRLTNRDGQQQYNMDGIAEVLLALERIEQNEELTYEQLLVLESNLFLGGLSFYDQHRDMRLDIDNMSYEELLALEEKMGNVSTALSEEALINCLKTSVYENRPHSQIMGDGDVSKCSICQEEYAEGDEIGRLGCEHGYHASCIQHWLRLKNWCPICKGSAAASASASAS